MRHRPEPEAGCWAKIGAEPGTLELSLEQAVHGCEEKIRVPSRDPCEVCDGSGAKAGEQRSASRQACLALLWHKGARALTQP